MSMTEPDPNLVLSVGELNRRLRRAVEDVTGKEWVVGEVGSAKRASSGHHYFCLKDEREDAMIDCVMYRGQGLRYLGLLVDGAKVQLFGKATLWSPRGRLQFIVERVRPAGRGALLEALERLKARLLEEGLFAPERKRPLPAEPKVVGVVTSAKGAAFGDILAVAGRRFGVHLVLAPAQVQGEGSVESLLGAIDLIERYPGLDVLIVGRGGGAGEDLMSFNDERLVRRLARTTVPVISAVGHDIDVTLADLVADVRAATPSQAAELAVPDRAALAKTLTRLSATLAVAMKRRLAEDRGVVETLRAKLRDPRFVVFSRQQQLDELAMQLERFIRARLRKSRPVIERLSRRVAASHPRWVIARARSSVRSLDGQLRASLPHKIRLLETTTSAIDARLQALSPLAVLGRGYAIASRLDGRVIRGPDDLAVGELFELRLGRGEILARSEENRSAGGNVVDVNPGAIDHESQ
ncbi:MAG: exodeoxyribonuclease VII large subunit [Polyangiaceae bacterium]